MFVSGVKNLVRNKLSYYNIDVLNVKKQTLVENWVYRGYVEFVSSSAVDI